MVKIEGITAFVAVAEAGSISEAARRLRLSKSVVSERVAELERGLNATLLHRTTRKLTLTEDGIAFRERAVRIVSEVQAAASDLAERRGQLTGPLRIAAPVSFGRRHLGPALYPFLARHPEIELTLELEGHRGVFYTNRGAADWRFEGPSGATIVRARLALGMNNGDMMHDAAVAGLGIALLPAFIAGPAVREGQLREIDVGLRPEPEFIYMAHPEGRRVSAKLRAIAQHLKEAFGDPPYWDP